MTVNHDVPCCTKGNKIGRNLPSEATGWKAKMRKRCKAVAAIILLSSVGRAVDRKTQQDFPRLKAKLRGKNAEVAQSRSRHSPP